MICENFRAADGNRTRTVSLEERDQARWSIRIAWSSAVLIARSCPPATARDTG